MTDSDLAWEGDGLAGHMLPRLSELGRYLILRPIGFDGVGAVYYAAFDPVLERTVALKVLHLEKDDAARLKREGQVMARLAHPNIVPIFDIGEEAGQLFVAMELVEGRSLRALLRNETVAVPRIIAIFAEAGEGLVAAHEAGVIHRDFKADTVLIGDDGRVRITDFGLALHAENDAQREGESIDQYAFALALKDALHGRGGARIQRALSRATASSPETRFSSMRELLDEVRHAQSKRRRGWMAAIALLAVAAAVVAPEIVRWYRTRACQSEARDILSIWNPIRRANLQQRFEDSDNWLSTSAAIDRFVQAWRDDDSHACIQVRVNSAESEAAFTQRQECFAERKGELAALLALFEHVPKERLREAAVAADALTPSRVCLEPALLNRPATSAAETADIASEVAAIKAAYDLGLFRETLPRVQALYERVRMLKNDNLVLKVDVWFGQFLQGAESATDSVIHFEDALVAAQTLGDSEAEIKINCLLSRAWVDYLQKPERALFLLRQASALAARTPPSPATMAVLYGAWADYHYYTADDSTIFLRDTERQKEFAIAAFGPEHPKVADALSAMCMALSALHRYADALHECSQAQAIWEKHHAMQDSHGIEVITREGEILQKSGRCQDALVLHERSAALAEKQLGRQSSKYANVLFYVGQDLLCLHRDADALVSFTEMQEIYRIALPPEHLSQILGPLFRGQALLALGQLRLASTALEQALALDRAFPNLKDERAAILQPYAEVLWASGKHEKALAAAREAQRLGPNNEVQAWIEAHTK